MNTIDVLENFYRSAIGPTMKEIYVTLNPVVASILEAGGRRPISLAGDDVIFKQGGYYQGMSNARLRAGETGRTYDTTIRNGRVTPEHGTMRWEVDTETLVFHKRYGGEKLSDYLEDMAERWINGWRDSHTIDVYGDGTSNLAEIAAVGAPGANDVEITERQVFRKLPEGMHIDVGTEANFAAGVDASIQRRTVVRQLSDTIFEIDNAATLAAGMKIKRELRRNGQTYSAVAADNTYINTFHGLRSNMATTGTLFNIPRDLVQYQPLEQNITALTGITFDDMVDLNTTAMHRGIDTGDYIIPVDQHNLLLKSFTADIVTNTKSEAFLRDDQSYREGITKVEFIAGPKKTSLYTDELLESDKGYGFDPSTWRNYEAANGIMVYGNGDPQIVNFGDDITGKGLIYDPSTPHAHAIEAVYAGQYACIQPRKNIVLNFV